MLLFYTTQRGDCGAQGGRRLERIGGGIGKAVGVGGLFAGVGGGVVGAGGGGKAGHRVQPGQNGVQLGRTAGVGRLGAAMAIVSGLTSKQATACATLAGDLDDAQATVRGVGSFAAGDSSSADVQAAVAAVQASAADVCDGAETALAAIVEQPEVGFLGTYDAATALDRLNVATAQSAVGAAAWVAASEAQRAMDNLTATPGATEAAAAFDSAVPSPQSVGGAAGQTIMQAGGDLYTVAARELGDATQWYRVAMSSGLDDPMLYGLNALTVPDAIQATSPGLPDVAGSEIL